MGRPKRPILVHTWCKEEIETQAAPVKGAAHKPDVSMRQKMRRTPWSIVIGATGCARSVHLDEPGGRKDAIVGPDSVGVAVRGVDIVHARQCRILA